MSTASVVTSSRVWSCSTLRDGVDYLLEEANKAEDEELELEKLVQDLQSKVSLPASAQPPEVPNAQSVHTAETQQATPEQLAAAQEGRGVSGGNSLPQVPLVTSQKPIVLDTAPEEQCEQTLRVDGPAQPKETKDGNQASVEAVPAPSSGALNEATNGSGYKPVGPLRPKTRQELLKDAAKAQLRRMCTIKKKRVALNADQWVIDEWKKRPKDETAQLLINANFDKDKFVAELEIIIRKTSKQKIQVKEEWLSEKEMRDEYKWSTAKINGAKKACEAKKETHIRKNVYDGVDEYYVVIKEKGQRSQELSHEEIRKKTERLEASEAPSLPSDAFDGLQKMADRKEADSRAPKEEEGKTQAQETAGKLKKFLESMIQKSGKLRSLSREIAENYSRSDQMMEQHKNLKTQLGKLDEQYDILNNLLAEGEVTNFKGEFVQKATTAMNTATYTCSSACAVETKTRNAKKYEKKDSQKEGSKPDGSEGGDTATKPKKPKRKGDKCGNNDPKKSKKTKK